MAGFSASTPSKPNGLLLIGTSHVGKSTCANSVSAIVGWPVVSTDMLGRHPGRPWTGVPDAVLEFYRCMSDDSIHWFLKVHHENMRRLIGAEIRKRDEAGEGFILEGAALRPEYIADWQVGTALMVCLYVEPQALRDRIQRASNYSRQGDEMKYVIDRFTERSVRENDALTEAAIKHRLQSVDVTDVNNADRLARELSSRLLGDTAG